MGIDPFELACQKNLDGDGQLFGMVIHHVPAAPAVIAIALPMICEAFLTLLMPTSRTTPRVFER
jgi:hypothetical protein